MEHFRLGIVDDPHAGHEEFQGRLSIPNVTVDQWGRERVVGLKFRLLDYEGKGDPRPKFLQPHGQQVRLYNLRALAEVESILVFTEGESDAWTVKQCGFPVVGVPGANQWAVKGANYRHRIFDGPYRKVLCRDNDEPGEALVKAMEQVDGLEVRTMAPHKDVREFREHEGVDALRARILGEETT